MGLSASILDTCQIDTPKCPQCGAQMGLARVTPDKPDRDQRTFDCPKCNHSIAEVKHK
jgi:DNA-directed RNA polymerase subunit RPC12/RpoP